MDIILLAGGSGTRMRPLTNTIPKPLLQVQGRPILEWSLLSARPIASHVIVVVHYLHEQITEYMRQQKLVDNYTIVQQQPQPLGTGHAVACCQPYLQSDGFMVINGDDLYDPHSLAKLAQMPLGIVTATRSDPWRWGVVVSKDDKFDYIHEKPAEGLFTTPAQVNTGAYKLDKRIFEYELPLSARGEYEITDYLSRLSGLVNIVPGDFWFPVGTPDDLAQARLLDLKAYYDI